MIVKLDYKIELFSVLIFLSSIEENGVIDRSDHDYSAKLKNKFHIYSTHKAVTEMPRFWDLGLCWDTIPFLTSNLDVNFTIKNAMPIPDRLIARFDCDFDEIVEFLQLVREFANVTEFKQFFDANCENELLKKINSRLQLYNPETVMEEYLGYSMNQLDVIVSNLFVSSFGIYDDYNLVCVMSGYSLRKARSEHQFDRLILSMIWHEFLHSIVNPLSDTLFLDPLKKTEVQWKWFCELNESIIWAIVFRLLIKTGLLREEHSDWYFKNALNNRAVKCKEMHDVIVQHERGGVMVSDFLSVYNLMQKKNGTCPQL